MPEPLTKRIKLCDTLLQLDGLREEVATVAMQGEVDEFFILKRIFVKRRNEIIKLYGG